MRIITFISSFLFLQTMLFGQAREIIEEDATKVQRQFQAPDLTTVSKHKDTLDLEIIIDNIQIHEDTLPINKKIRLKINFESDYIQVHDSLSIKIYLSRNKENGKRFYGMRWEYFVMTKNKYKSIGKSIFIKAFYNYNQRIAKYNNPNGFGMGVKGSPQYFMIHYWYILR